MTTTEITQTTAAPATVADMFPVDESDLQEFTLQAQNTASALAEVDPSSPAFADAVDRVREIGRDEVSQSSAALEELLGRRVIPDSGNTPAIDSATAQLDDLRDAVVDLDPSGSPSTFRGRLSKAISKLPGGKGLRKAIAGYESAGAQINHIAEALKASRKTLADDTDLAKVEMRRLWDDLSELGAQDAKFTALVQAVQDKVAELRKDGNTAQADALESEALTAMNIRRQDVSTHAAVVLNAYMTLKVLTETGKKLSDSVYYAENTSLTALRLVSASDIVSGAQEAVANQVDSVREVTGQLMVKSAQQNAERSARAHEQATRTAVGIDELKKSFQTTYGAIEQATKSGIEANTKIQSQLDDLNSGLAELRDRGFNAETGAPKKGALTR